jgi:hypothetical protein
MIEKKLIFVSRHAPNDGQIALVKKLGYDSIEQESIVFRKDPVKDLEAAEIKEKTIALVAPSYITNQLLNAGYILIEFVNSAVKREKMVFCCEGAYQYQLKCVPKDYQGDQWDAFIEQKYIECPMSIDEQVESSLVPEKVREA